jgi:glyoxalase family protein
MSTHVTGIHHVTAIAGDPQRNVDFYGGVLGLRLVKRTVNFDDPQTYHLYYGDETGTPGSILTFFPWPNGRRGRQGTGQVAVTSFSVLPSALSFWIERLVKSGVHFDGPARRFDEQVVTFRDPNGLMLEIVAHPGAEARAVWAGGPVFPDAAIRGLHALTLWEDASDATSGVLTDTLGFRPVAEEGSTRRYAAGDGGPGTLVDVRAIPGFLRGLGGLGTVHHVAWRVPDDPAELRLRERIIAAGLEPTAQVDRQYFHSVYFREPGGVLFEIATDAPGFATDEPVERLGEGLMLPPQYEPYRAEIEAVLPPLHLAAVPLGEET